MNPIDVAQVLFDAGFRGDRLVTGLAVVRAESGFNPLATNTAGNTPPSTDRGLWQINDHWHAEVSDECAFDALCSSREAFRISNGGRNYGPWSAFKNGSYQKYLPLAEVAHEAAKRLRQAQRENESLQVEVTVRDQRITTLDTALTIATDKQLKAEAAVAAADERLGQWHAWYDQGGAL